jgi:type III secretion protein C
MKINTLITRTAVLLMFIALFSMQLLIGANNYNFNLDSETSENSRDLSSILRNQKTINLPSETSKNSTSYFYDLSENKSQHPSHIHIPIVEDKDLISQADENISAGINQNDQKKVMINFNNVSMVEYIRFVSRISNRNFVFDENDLQFNVTIISEEPASIENIMTALMQELRIHDLSLIEDGNNMIVHRNPKVSSISKVVSEDIPNSLERTTDIVTRVFRLNTLDTEKAIALLRPLVSEAALVEGLNNQIIITDITANVEKISTLLKSLDAPNSGLVIGQYVSRLTPIDTLIPMGQQIMLPISLEQPLTFVPQPTTNSIFIVSTPFLVERTISILEYLDQDQGATRILNLKDLKFGGSQINQRAPLKTLSGQWLNNAQGDWMFKPEATTSTTTPSNNPPIGAWSRDTEGNWNFTQGTTPSGAGPKGHWTKDQNGNWVFQLDPNEEFKPGALIRQFQGRPQLPGGLQKVLKYFIFKLQFRRGESVEPALRQIADTLQQNGRGGDDLINTLRSVQWLVTPNSLVLSGTDESLARARELIIEIDTPMRQVLIDMLILESSLQDSLNFGVTYGTRFGGGNISGSQGFVTDPTTNPLPASLATTGFANLGGTIGTAVQLIPNGTNFANTAGFNLGVIGQKITHCGTEFGSIGALVSALHDRSKDKVVSNPKILVEDGASAELFVGINTPYRTQSISNDFGSVITSNFEYRDVGTRLRVTPYIGNGDIIAMDIEEEISTILAGLITNATTASTSPGPTTRINRTTTRVHIPDGYFLIISGMMQNEESRERNQVPCLGGVPLLGAAFSAKNNTDTKRNLMIFIRPKIVDTEEEIQTITRHNQNIYDYKNCFKNSDEYETVEALDLLNIRKTLHPEDEYECECECDSCGCFN